MFVQDDCLQNTKELIADTFLRLLQKQSIDSITVRMVTEECGISRNTFYYHYEDVFAVIVFIFSKMLDQEKEDHYQGNDMLESIMIIIRMINNNLDFLFKIIRSKWAQRFLKYMASQIEKELESAWANSSDRNMYLRHEDLVLCLRILTYGLVGNAIVAIEKNRSIDAKVMTSVLYRLATGQVRLLE